MPTVLSLCSVLELAGTVSNAFSKVFSPADLSSCTLVLFSSLADYSFVTNSVNLLDRIGDSLTCCV